MFHRDVDYFLEPIILSVEGILFRIPREYLAQASHVFADMFNLPQPEAEDGVDNITEGSRDATPVPLPGISASAFRSILRLLYPPESEVNLNKDEWLGVLHLSEMWAMSEIWIRAISHLRPLLEDDPTYMVHLAKRYHIDEWMRPALEVLTRRSAPLGNREFEMLDQDTLLKIAAVRECCYPVFKDSDSRYGQPHSPDTSIGHWEVRTERGIVPVDLREFAFTCPEVTSVPSDPGEEEEEIEGPRRDGEFYFEKIVFRVEDRCFKLPSQPFAQQSSKFRHDFEKRGFLRYDHHDPFVLDGVTVADFRSLLRLFFPPQKPLGEYELNADEWASILRLSVKWDMSHVKRLAVQKLEDMDFGSVTAKLKMARELGVQEWFSSAVKTLITQSSPLTVPECQALADENDQRQQLMQQILDLRERAHHRTYLYPYGASKISVLRSERGELPGSYDLSARVASLL